MNDEVIQMANDDPDPGDMPTDVDFSDAANPEVGKYAGRFGSEVRMVVLEGCSPLTFERSASARSVVA